MKDIRSEKDIEILVSACVKKGYSRSEIKREAARNTTLEKFDADTLNNIVDDIVNGHGTYELVQKILRSKIIKNIRDEKDTRIIDPVQKDYLHISPGHFRTLLDKSVNLDDRTYLCEFVYKPFDDSYIIRKDHTAWQYNSYQPPEWYKSKFYSGGEKEISKIKFMPKIHERFFRHLTDGDKESYNYLVKWLANAVQSRNFCILATIGKQGVGKGMLGYIMRGIFGPSNYYEGRDEMFKNKFNSQIMNRRLVYCDEISITKKEDEDKLKVIVNNYVEIEKKGMDAVEVENHASFYVSSNNMDSIKLSGDDRRFSILNLTDKKLIEVFSDEEIAELLEPGNINMLAMWLYHFPVDSAEMKKVFISKRTAEVRDSSRKEWEDYFLDEYCAENAGKTLPQTQVSDDLEERFGNKWRPSRAALQKLYDTLPSDQRIFSVGKRTIGKKVVWCVIFVDKDEEL